MTNPLIHIRKIFISGLLFWVPLIITVAIVQFVLKLTVRLLELIPVEYLPEAYLKTSFPGINILVIFIIILFSGWIFNQYLGKKLLSWWEKILSKIPLVRSIYNASKQSMSTFLSSSSSSFNEVVLVEYPRRGMWSIAFVTNQCTEDFNTSKLSDDEYVSVYIPTTPNPTSGFIILVPRKDLRLIQLTTEEALKWVISLGIINPKDQADANKH